MSAAIMDGNNMRNSLTQAQAHQMAMARQSILVQAQQAQQHELLQRQHAQAQARQQQNMPQQQMSQQQQQQMAAAVAQHRNSFFMPNFQQQAENMAMVTTAKLAIPKKNKGSTSTLAVRSTVPRYNVAGGIYSVAQWARKCVEDNLEFIVKLARRNDPKAQAVMLAYGDGCQTIVLLDDAMNKMPVDVSKIKKIDIGVSAAPIEDKTVEDKMASAGVLTPTDSLWDHLRYEQSNVTKEKQEHVMFIHTSMTVYGGGTDGRRRVLQINTEAPKKPYVAIQYVSNPAFEQEVLAKWTGRPLQVQQAIVMAANFPPGPMSTAAAAAYVAATTPDDEPEFLITFNPKEILLLEKAFDEKLSTRDMKSKADKWEEKDQIKCQATIKRLQNEFIYVDPTKPTKKKVGPSKKKQSDEKKKSATTSTAAVTETKKDKPTDPKKPATKKVAAAQDDKKEEKAKATIESPKKAKKTPVAKVKATKESPIKAKKTPITKRKAIKESPAKAKKTPITKGKATKESPAKAKKTPVTKGKAAKESPAKAKKTPVTKGKAAKESSAKVKRTLPISKGKATKEPVKKVSPAEIKKKRKSKVETEKSSTPAKPKTAVKKSTPADKKPKSVTKKASVPEKKEPASKKRGRESKSKDVGASPKKTRSKSKPRTKR